MVHNQYSSDLAAKCLTLIKQHGPILAIDLAAHLGIVGGRENMRRKIRAIVQHLRNDCGEMVCADLIHGYYIAPDKEVWQMYLDGRQLDAKKILGITHRQLKMVTDGQGQGLLFLPGAGSLNNGQFTRTG